MIEICRNLFVGSEHDEASIRGQPGWFVIHACKEPYHRQALGYRSQGAPKHHPEYLIARRTGRLILNLVDAPDVNYIPSEIIDAALVAIDENILWSTILIHCNLGQSRSPAIAFLYLAKYSSTFEGRDCEEALLHYQTIYPRFTPAKGMLDYIKLNWQKYSSRK